MNLKRIESLGRDFSNRWGERDLRKSIQDRGASRYSDLGAISDSEPLVLSFPLGLTFPPGLTLPPALARIPARAVPLFLDPSTVRCDYVTGDNRNPGYSIIFNYACTSQIRALWFDILILY